MSKVELVSLTPDAEKMERIMKHLGKTLLPSIQPFERTIKSITGEPGKTGELYELPKEVAGIFGWRLNKVEPKKALGFYIYDFRSGRSEATKEFTGGVEGLLKGGVKTPQDVIERFFVANKALFEVNKKMLNHVKRIFKPGKKCLNCYVMSCDAMLCFDTI